ncbi:MAG: hypothetical protein ACRC9P_02070 [Bacteroides sp.]
MSKVEIKFWNSKKNEYETEDERLILESDGSVAEIRGCGPSNGLALYGVDDCIVPHFYKYGKRIA